MSIIHHKHEQLDSPVPACYTIMRWPSFSSGPEKDRNDKCKRQEHSMGILIKVESNYQLLEENLNYKRPKQKQRESVVLRSRTGRVCACASTHPRPACASLSSSSGHSRQWWRTFARPTSWWITKEISLKATEKAHATPTALFGRLFRFYRKRLAHMSC